MRALFAAALFAHGLAHLVGFLAYTRLGRLRPAAYRSRLLQDRLRISDSAERALGVVWLLLAAGFFVIAGGVGLGRPWWPGPALGLTIASLGMCLVGLPASWIGALVDVGILLALLFRSSAG